MSGRFVGHPERWKAWWDETQSELPGWIAPWFAEQPEELRDANPVFSARCPERALGLRVIEHVPWITRLWAPQHDLVTRDDWFDPNGPLRTHELVIACSFLDRDAAEILDRARRAFLDWVKEQS